MCILLDVRSSCDGLLLASVHLILLAEVVVVGASMTLFGRWASVLPTVAVYGTGISSPSNVCGVAEVWCWTSIAACSRHRRNGPLIASRELDGRQPTFCDLPIYPIRIRLFLISLAIPVHRLRLLVLCKVVFPDQLTSVEEEVLYVLFKGFALFFEAIHCDHIS